MRHFERIMKSLPVVLGIAAISHAHPGHHAPEAGRGKADTVTAMRERLAVNSDDLAALRMLGEALLEKARQSTEHEEFAAAAAIFERLASLDPGSVAALVGISHADIGRHRFTDALEAARRAAASDTNSPMALAALVDAHYALGHDVEADALLRRIEAIGVNVATLSRRALLQARAGALAESSGSLDAAIGLARAQGEPADVESWLLTMRGDIAFEAGEGADALAWYEDAAGLAPESSVPMWRRSVALTHLGRAQDAVAPLRGLVEKSPIPRHWVALADALEQIGQIDEADSLRDLALEDMERDVEHGDMGHARELAELLLTLGRPEEAAEFALRDLREVRQDPGAYALAAWALHCAGRSDEGATMARYALRGSAGSARDLCRLGLVLHEAGAQIQGRMALTQALSRRHAVPEALAIAGAEALNEPVTQVSTRKQPH